MVAIRSSRTKEIGGGGERINAGAEISGRLEASEWRKPEYIIVIIGEEDLTSLPPKRKEEAASYDGLLVSAFLGPPDPDSTPHPPPLFLQLKSCSFAILEILLLACRRESFFWGNLSAPCLAAASSASNSQNRQGGFAFLKFSLVTWSS